MRKKKLKFKMNKEESLKVSTKSYFKGTKAWFYCTKKNMKLSRRVPTHVVQKLYEKSGKDIQVYLAKLQQLKLDILTNARRLDLVLCNSDGKNPSIRYGLWKDNSILRVSRKPLYKQQKVPR